MTHDLIGWTMLMAAESLPGKLKEWSLILYGTAEPLSSNLSSHHSRSRMLEMPSSETEPSKAAFFQTQADMQEEEEEYTG